MRRIVIVGTGGCAREVHQIIEDIHQHTPSWEVAGFLDDNPAMHGTLVHGLPVLGGIECLAGASLDDAAVVVGIGNPGVRRRLVQRIARLAGPRDYPVLVHPQAQVGQRVTLGAGSVLWQGAVITVDVVLGEQVIVNTCCSISHDSHIGDYVTFAPAVNVAGNVTVGEGVDFGIGANIIHGKTIGEWSIIGAGAVVISNIEANATAVGVPARSIKSRTAGWHLT